MGSYHFPILPEFNNSIFNRQRWCMCISAGEKADIKTVTPVNSPLDLGTGKSIL